MEDEDLKAIEEILREDRYGVVSEQNDDHGWQTVSYQKKNRRKQVKQTPENFSGGIGVGVSGDVFLSIEQHSEDRRRRLETQRAAIAAAVGDNSAVAGDGEDGSDVDGDFPGGVVENGDVKKSKPKKPKKPKVSVAEAAAKIDASDLYAFLLDIDASYESQQDIQLMRLADYFGRAFSKVNASQFPWMKIIKESSIAKMVDIPLGHIAEAVYKTSVDWLNQRSLDALGAFVLWSLDSILDDLALHQGPVKSKKMVQQAPPKSQVAIFVVLSMVLRRKPDVLISLLPIIKENSRYQGQDKLPVIVWAINQACQGDLVLGLFMWVHYLLPMLSSKSSCNPQSRDLILQLVERILSPPKAHTILVNGAVRKGERLVPPSALELLVRATFPAPSARVKATERFEAIYPTLKDVALAVAPGSKAMRLVTQQIMPFSVKAAGEGIPDLSREASDLFIWCLAQNPDCYKQWDDIYLDNIEASINILKKLSDEWKVHSVKHANHDSLKVTLKSFKEKNEKAMGSENDTARLASLKDAQKYCKIILGRVVRGHVCMKNIVFVTVAFAIGAAFISKAMPSWDLDKLFVKPNLP
ncbi:unnamed protein product [Ilex paraguariensis]|uniref:Transmembrane protein n=1 Tax=Ilex paraguariensis TaxID=185542 RepID=A0ABC8SJ06_9AQUA